MNHLKHSIFWFTFSILLAWIGIAHSKQWEHHCAAKAIADGWSYEIRTGMPARIEITNLIQGFEVVGHAQAQGQKEDGSWIYLTTHKTDGMLRDWEKHFKSSVFIRYQSLDQFIDEQQIIRRINP